MIPDISHYHPVQYWDDVKNNCSFIISKATQGTSFIDNTLDSFIRGCEKYKIPYYLYTYLNKNNELVQAKFLVDTCKNKVGAYFMGYVLDVEENNSAKDVKNALTYISKQSRKCMLYTGWSRYDKYKDVINNRPKNCAWWEARYGKYNDGKYDSAYPCHDGVDLHQYTSLGMCPGVKGKADLNRLTGSKPLSWFIDVKQNNQGSELAYYKSYKGTSKRIDTVFKAIGVPKQYRGTYAKRTPIAKANGIKAYCGSASQNIELIQKAKKGTLKKP